MALSQNEPERFQRYASRCVLTNAEMVEPTDADGIKTLKEYMVTLCGFNRVFQNGVWLKCQNCDLFSDCNPKQIFDSQGVLTGIQTNFPVGHPNHPKTEV